MRRPGARHLGAAIERAAGAAVPETLLARVQASWAQVAGEVAAAEATPVAEGGGSVTFECRSAVWAEELSLLEPELRERLNAILGGGAAAPLARLRFRSGAGAGRAATGRARRAP